jgi:hypothetical protein
MKENTEAEKQNNGSQIDRGIPHSAIDLKVGG